MESGLMYQSIHGLLEVRNIGIKHGFPYIKICQVPREVLKTEVEDQGF